MRSMRVLYPDYEQADFFLKYSVENHMKPNDSSVRAERQWLMMVTNREYGRHSGGTVQRVVRSHRHPGCAGGSGLLACAQRTDAAGDRENGARRRRQRTITCALQHRLPAIDKTIIDMLMASWNMDGWAVAPT